MYEPMYFVVINDEEQYSIWPDFKPVPAGWSIVGGSDSRENCLARIQQWWTDLRPRSLRERVKSAS